MGSQKKKKKKKNNENCQISIFGFQFVVKRIIQGWLKILYFHVCLYLAKSS